MRGVGEATAAISIVNALPTGVGAAAGIDLRVRAEVILKAGPPDPPRTVDYVPSTAASPLARGALAAAVERYAGERLRPTRLSIDSAIPVSAGLKSSSAVASAIVGAVAEAAGAHPNAEEIARLSAEVGRSTGVSATGAFDDALAGLERGVVLTDNRGDRVLRRIPLDPGLGVALWVPPGSHPPAPLTRSRFSADDPGARSCVRAVTDGRLWEAMELNSNVVEVAMGYDYRALRAELRSRGAIASGVSGLGPTVAAVGLEEKLSDIVGAFDRLPGTHRTVRFSTPEARSTAP